MHNLTELTLLSALEALSRKEFSSTELTKAFLARIEAHDSKINSFITVCKEEALRDASKADARLTKGEKQPLLGIPVALKDIFVTKNIQTTAASNVLRGYIGQYDGTVVQKFKAAGAVIIGKTNCDAWAHGSSGENSDFGATLNPYNLDYIPGGSSSGSAASVAASMALMSTGTDTGGSIRLPGSFTNTVGLKPTYGRVSRYGVMAMASSLDSIGHFTKTVADSAHVLSLTAGQDVFDSTTPPNAVPDYNKALHKGVKGLKIGKPKEYDLVGMDQNVKHAWEKALETFSELGAEIVELSLPHTQYAIAVYYIIQTAEVSSNLARYDGIRLGNARDTFGDEAKRRIMLGTYVLSAGYYDAYYKKAMQVRTLIVNDFKEAFEKADVILTPASPTLPWKLGAKMSDPLQMYLSDIYTVTANLAGIPGLSLPADFDKDTNLPIGMQLLAPQFREDLLFQAGSAYEAHNPLWRKAPVL